MAGRAVDAVVRSGWALVDRVRPGHAGADGPVATRALTVGRAPDELRRLWGDPVQLGRVLAEPRPGGPSAWTVDDVSVVDGVVRFHARAEAADQDEAVEAAGRVTFAEAADEPATEVTLDLRLVAADGAPDAPRAAGAPGAAGAAAYDALLRAKALAETGEIPAVAPGS